MNLVQFGIQCKIDTIFVDWKNSKTYDPQRSMSLKWSGKCVALPKLLLYLWHLLYMQKYSKVIQEQ